MIANVDDQDGSENSLVVSTLVDFEKAKEIASSLTFSFKRITIVQFVMAIGDGKTI